MASNLSDGSQLGKIAGYIEILAKDPRSTVFVPLAETYRQLGLLDDALEVASRGVQVLTRFSPGYTVLGRVQAQRGDLAAAVAAFEKALLLDPENLTSLKGLANVRMRRGERPQAEQLLKRAAALKPDDAQTQKMLAALGPVPVVAPEPLSAEEAEGEALPAEGDPISTATIAEIYIRQGFYGRAMKVYRDLLQVDPHNEEIRRKLVDLKQRIERQTAPPAAVEPAAVGGLPETAAPPLPPSPESAQAEAMPPAEPADESSRQMAILSRWLEAINSRRNAHVR